MFPLTLALARARLHGLLGRVRLAGLGGIGLISASAA